MFFFQRSHQQIKPSAAREACQIHLWIMTPECVNASPPYFKQSHLTVTALDVRMSYDVTLWEERSPRDIPDLLLSSRQLNICHMNIKESLNESYSKGIVLRVIGSIASSTSAGMKLILNCWLVTPKCVIILCSGCIISSHREYYT